MRAPEVFLRGPNSRAFILFPRKNATIADEGDCLAIGRGHRGKHSFPLYKRIIVAAMGGDTL
jgi:hypothetical protein